MKACSSPSSGKDDFSPHLKSIILEMENHVEDVWDNEIKEVRLTEKKRREIIFIWLFLLLWGGTLGLYWWPHGCSLHLTWNSSSTSKAFAGCRFSFWLQGILHLSFPPWMNYVELFCFGKHLLSLFEISCFELWEFPWENCIGGGGKVGVIPRPAQPLPPLSSQNFLLPPLIKILPHHPLKKCLTFSSSQNLVDAPIRESQKCFYGIRKVLCKLFEKLLSIQMVCTWRFEIIFDARQVACVVQVALDGPKLLWCYETKIWVRMLTWDGHASKSVLLWSMLPYGAPVVAIQAPDIWDDTIIVISSKWLWRCFWISCNFKLPIYQSKYKYMAPLCPILMQNQVKPEAETLEK